MDTSAVRMRANLCALLCCRFFGIERARSGMRHMVMLSVMLKGSAHTASQQGSVHRREAATLRPAYRNGVSSVSFNSELLCTSPTFSAEGSQKFNQL